MTRGARRIAVLLVLAMAPTASAAPPQVEIRAQTKLSVDRVRLTGNDVVEIRGSLLDNLTGDGVAGQPIAVRIGDATATAVTGLDGGFRAQLTAAPGLQQVELVFRGTALLSSSRLSQESDPSRAQVTLTLELEDAPGGVTVMVRATADDQPAQLQVTISVGAPGDARLTELGVLTTGQTLTLTRKAAGGPGTRKIRATFAGDDAHQAATIEKAVELSAGSTTTMKLSAVQLAYEDALEVTGAVIDDDAHPVRRAAVTLASGDRRLAQGATAEDGSYKFKVEGEILGQGQWGLQVQADPGSSSIDPPGAEPRPAGTAAAGLTPRRSTSSIRPSRSAPAIIRVAAPQPVPVSYTIAAFLATACAAGGFFMARAKPWRRLRRPAPPADMPAHPAQDEQVEGGLVVAKPGLVSTLRRPADDGFSGAVRDTVRGRPVADAVVRLRLQQGRDDREALTGPDGNFAFEALATGDWVADVTAPGHVTEKFMISIPHRGELRGVRVDLVPVRERVFQLYRRAAEPILPEPRLWGVWSPRQIVDHVRSKRPTPALADLTSFVEEIYFSPRLAGETVLPEASEQVDRAIRERARAAPTAR
jgi:hypothetical protein